jgi:hypothetical protein
MEVPMRLPLIALCLLPTFAFAALPPQYQRQAELVAIIQDRAVEQALQDEPIGAVRMTGVDVYQVTSESCKVVVGIVDTPMQDGMVGPRQFAVVVNAATCK